MSEKSDFICSFCLKILKDPINLPCFDIICQSHLKETSISEKKCIECPTCKRNFNTDTHEFVPNKILKNLIDKQLFLSDEEKTLKKSLEKSLQEFFKLKDQYLEAKNGLEIKSRQHFEELRFQIDLHREQLIEKIDKVYLLMIDQTKKVENSFSKNLVNKLEPTDILIMTINTLEDEKEEINEIFRGNDLKSKLLIEKQHNQEEAIVKINSNLNKLSKFLEVLKESNEFKPNLASFPDNDSFGVLKLNDFAGNVFRRT